MSPVSLPPADTGAPLEGPVACAPYAAGGGVTVLPSYVPLPGMGVLPINAFLIDGPEPMLVDAGPGGLEEGFRAGLASVVDPASLRWLWLTHTDPDHTASLRWLLDTAPDLKVVTTYLAVGKLSFTMEVPMDRLLWVNPGTTVELNGRRLEALRPPSYDAPETVAFHDHTSGTLFPADSFGGLVQSPVVDAADVAPGDLADGMALWTTVDTPWLTRTDRGALASTLGRIRALGAERVLSSHLPPATGMVEILADNLARVPGSQPWVGPDQAALDQLLATVAG